MALANDHKWKVAGMLAKRIIPCLDVHQGRVVKGTNFLNLRDAGDPVEIASKYEQEGADELVFLDITASHEQRDIIIDVVRRTSEQRRGNISKWSYAQPLWDSLRQYAHPELRVFYDRCVVRFDTHSVGGISINDFICAAKADALVAFVA